jgi:OOP family OmpA-OmpF porin
MKTTQVVLLNTFALITLILSGIAVADEISKQGYLLDSRANIVRSGSGLCIHTGSWTPAMAIAECDSTPAKQVVPVIISSTPEIVSPPPVAGKRVVYAPYTLQTETLFAYNNADLSTDGKQQIHDKVVGMLKQSANDGEVLITGHADRIGSDEYNMALSQRRAETVAAYLIEQGIDRKHITTAAKGESEPVVTCDMIKGPANHMNLKLISCLQPNRRIVLTLTGQHVSEQ